MTQPSTAQPYRQASILSANRKLSRKRAPRKRQGRFRACRRHRGTNSTSHALQSLESVSAPKRLAMTRCASR